MGAIFVRIMRDRVHCIPGKCLAGGFVMNSVQFSLQKGRSMQKRKHSAIESVTNVAVGYFVAVLSQIIIFPFFGINVPFSANITIGLWFTAISIIRSYILRRIFTRWTE